MKSEATLAVKVKPEVDFSGLCVVQPGDTLIVAIWDHISESQAQAVKDRLNAKVDCGVVVIAGCAGLAVVRSEQASDAVVNHP